LSGLDLNLVRAFVAIYETQSVTKAAERLAVSQPTLSHSLAKLRNVYSDQLFTRGAAGLSSTSLADQLYERFSRALEDPKEFDSSRSSRMFRLAMSDMGTLSFTHAILQRFQGVAPNIEIDVQKIDDRVIEDLSVGRLDVVIGNLPALAAVSRSQPLFREHYVCLLSSAHPSIGSHISVEDFSACRQIVLSTPTPTPGNRRIDEALSDLGLSRRIVARVPHFSGLAQLLVQSDLLVVVPSRAARIYLQQGGLKVVDLPISLSDFEVRVSGTREMKPAHPTSGCSRRLPDRSGRVDSTTPSIRVETGLGVHQTIEVDTYAQRTPRRRHSVELKTQVLAQCDEPGVSIAAVAQLHGLNANLVHKWRRGRRQAKAAVTPAQARDDMAGTFVALQLPTQSTGLSVAQDIRIELRRGATSISLSWPCTAASACAVWLRELLR